MKTKKGLALLWVLMLSAVLLIISSTMVSYITKESKFSVNIEDSTKAYAAARSGIDWGINNPAAADPTKIVIEYELENGVNVPTVYADVSSNGTLVTSIGSASGNVSRKIEYTVTTSASNIGTEITPSKYSNVLDINNHFAGFSQAKQAGTNEILSTNSDSFTLNFDFWENFYQKWYVGNSGSGGGSGANGGGSTPVAQSIPIGSTRLKVGFKNGTGSNGIFAVIDTSYTAKEEAQEMKIAVGTRVSGTESIPATTSTEWVTLTGSLVVDETNVNEKYENPYSNGFPAAPDNTNANNYQHRATFKYNKWTNATLSIGERIIDASGNVSYGECTAASGANLDSDRALGNLNFLFVEYQALDASGTIISAGTTSYQTAGSVVDGSYVNSYLEMPTNKQFAMQSYIDNMYLTPWIPGGTTVTGNSPTEPAIPTPVTGYVANIANIPEGFTISTNSAGAIDISCTKTGGTLTGSCTGVFLVNSVLFSASGTPPTGKTFASYQWQFTNKDGTLRSGSYGASYTISWPCSVGVDGCVAPTNQPGNPTSISYILGSGGGSGGN